MNSLVHAELNTVETVLCKVTLTLQLKEDKSCIYYYVLSYLLEHDTDMILSQLQSGSYGSEVQNCIPRQATYMQLEFKCSNWNVSLLL